VLAFPVYGRFATAALKLVDELSAGGVTILIVHDFDIAGLSIAHWLWHDNERYRFKHRPRVIDLGLRLDDVNKMGLQSEEHIHRQRKDPTDKFLDWYDDEVTEEEADFLRGAYSPYKRWVGKRVKNKEMKRRKLINGEKKKSKQGGVKKVVPKKKTLAVAGQRAVEIAKAREIIEEEKEEQPPVPMGLEKKVRDML